MRRLVPLAAAGLVLLGAVPAPAAPTNTHILAGRAGATWLVTQLDNNHYNGFAGPDWGLTIDGLLALRATGVNPGTASAVRDEVAAHAGEFITPPFAPDTTDAGSASKLLVAAVSTASDPAHFGGVDLRTTVVSLVRPSGIHAGRVSDAFSDDGDPANDFTSDQSNTFDQALAVVGLARSGGVPQNVVDFLIKQQCATGGFRLDPDVGAFPDPETPSPSCDEATSPVLDPDSTAMAVQALLVAAEHGATGASTAAAKGAQWLAGVQRADGSFGGSGPTAGIFNSNSTGLAGEALAAAGNAAAANSAADWLVAIQRTAAPDAGAIAYNPETFAAGPPEDFARDQWIRGTAQAVLALAQVPLGKIGDVAPPTPAPVTTPTPAATPSPSGSAAPGSGGGLPITGTSTVTMVGVAAGLVVLGTVLVLLGRRRRTT